MTTNVPSISIDELSLAIAAALASESPDLGITSERAEMLRDAIECYDLADDKALSAHDLLHTRAVCGRAF
jgi:hypothetical protein